MLTGVFCGFPQFLQAIMLCTCIKIGYKITYLSFGMPVEYVQ
jgi:hypothetical protein